MWMQASTPRKCSSSAMVSLAMDGRLNAARRTPTLTRIDFAVLPAAEQYLDEERKQLVELFLQEQ